MQVKWIRRLYMTGIHVSFLAIAAYLLNSWVWKPAVGIGFASFTAATVLFLAAEVRNRRSQSTAAV